MYFCNDVTTNDNTRKGLFKKVNYISAIATNEWKFENGVINIVDGDKLMFAVRSFGFFETMDVDVLFCNDDYMLVKLLQGKIYVKGGKDNVTLCVGADGEVGLVEGSENKAIRWYDCESLQRILKIAIRNQNEMPEDFEPTMSMYNNLMFTLTCENKAVKSGNTNSMCVSVRPNTITPLEGYDYDGALNKARNAVKQPYGISVEMVAKQMAYYMEHKDEIEAADAEKRAEAEKKGLKVKKPSTKGLKKAKAVDDDSAYDYLYDADSAYDDVDDVDNDVDAGDYVVESTDGLSDDELQEILYGVKIQEAMLKHQGE